MREDDDAHAAIRLRRRRLQRGEDARAKFFRLRAEITNRIRDEPGPRLAALGAQCFCRTIAHRRAIGALTPDQSDRLMRVVRVIAAAENTFGSFDKAHRWLRRPTTALEGDAPLELLDTSEGSRQVERLLGRIDHGLAA